MRAEHPGGYHTIVMQKGTDILADVETAPTAPGWVEFGPIGSPHCLMIDRHRREVFVALVAEAAAIKKGRL